jgi:mannose-6-phosphate isomerase-like protein (cupin superfamily)
MEKVNIAEKLALIPDHWNPHIAGRLNGQDVRLSKIQGEFIWHHHDGADELFLVIKGRLKMRFRTHDVEVNPGEFLIVPAGVEHLPTAEEETHLLLFEPAETLNTGNVRDERTRDALQTI